MKLPRLREEMTCLGRPPGLGEHIREVGEGDRNELGEVGRDRVTDEMDRALSALADDQDVNVTLRLTVEIDERAESEYYEEMQRLEENYVPPDPFE